MLIILEGPDGVGKSTLAGQIVTYLTVKYPDDIVELHHRGPPHASPLEEYAAPLIGYRPMMGVHLVLDRWHWGEMIYPKILGRRSSMTRAMFEYIEQLIWSLGGITINMPLTDETMNRFKQRGDDLVKLHQLGDIAEAYAKLYVNTATGYMPNDYIASNVAWYARGQELAAKERNERRWMQPRSSRTVDVRSIPVSSSTS